MDAVLSRSLLRQSSRPTRRWCSHMEKPEKTLTRPPSSAAVRKLPPLNAIKAFEVTARLLSFTKAGAELNVTYGAISRQVTQLERSLGVTLFQRANSQLLLTEAGKALLDEVSPALDRIATAVYRLKHNPSPVTIVVNAPPTFTLRWLIPRLSTFHTRHPSINIRVTTSTTSLSPIDFASHEYNIAIRGGQKAFPGMSSRRFLSETIVVVCHPDLLEKLRLASPADLEKHTLLSYGILWLEGLVPKRRYCRRQMRRNGELRTDVLYFAGRKGRAWRGSYSVFSSSRRHCSRTFAHTAGRYRSPSPPLLRQSRSGNAARCCHRSVL